MAEGAGAVSEKPDAELRECYEPEEDYEPEDDCGMLPDGSCTMAGSEWCDWECPNSLLFRKRTKPALREKKNA